MPHSQDKNKNEEEYLTIYKNKNFVLPYQQHNI